MATHLFRYIKYDVLFSSSAHVGAGMLVLDGEKRSSSSSATCRVVNEPSPISGGWPMHSDTNLYATHHQHLNIQENA